MPIEVDDVVQDANALRTGPMEKYKAELAAKGYSEARLGKFDASLDNLLKKDSAQKTAQAALLQKTQEQDAAINTAIAVITKFQNAGKAAFGRDRVRLKEFKVGTDKPKSVGGLITMLEYFTGVAGKYTAELLANGLTEDDLSGLSTVYGALVAADASQENAKKLRNAATSTRDGVLSILKEEVFKVRKLAQVVFAGDKAVLEEFKPIQKGRGKATPKQPTGDQQQPQK